MKSFYLYGFVFSAIIALLIFFNSKKGLERQEKEIQKLEKQVQQLELQLQENGLKPN